MGSVNKANSAVAALFGRIYRIVVLQLGFKDARFEISSLGEYEGYYIHIPSLNVMIRSVSDCFYVFVVETDNGPYLRLTKRLEIRDVSVRVSSSYDPKMKTSPRHRKFTDKELYDGITFALAKIK